MSKDEWQGVLGHGLTIGGPAGESRPMQHGFYKGALSAVTLGVLFLLLGVYREHIIPVHADHEQQRWLLTGDEPGYLLAGVAFAAGDGLDLGPAQRRGEHLRFFDREILEPGQFTWTWHFGGRQPMFTSSNWWGTQQIKRQMPGLSILIAPLAHCHQYRWAVAFTEALLICVLAALLLWSVHRLPLFMFSSAAWAVLCFLACAPIAFYATQVFPETFTGVFLVLSLLMFDSQKSWQRQAGALLLVATLWLTPRVMGGVCLAVGVLVWHACRQRSWGEVAICVVGLALFFAYNLAVWDMLLPTPLEMGSKTAAIMGAMVLLIGVVVWRWRPRGWVIMGMGWGLALVLLVHSVCLQGAASVLDQNSQGLAKLEWICHNFCVVFFGNDVGIFFLNPALWLGFVAVIWLFFFRRDEFFWLWSALFIGVLMSIAITPEWRAGTCPAGRYGTIPAYLLLLPLIRFFASAPPVWGKRVLVALVGLGIVGLTMGWLMAHAPNFWYRAYHPLFGYPKLQPFYDWLPPSDPARVGFKVYCFCWLLIFCFILGGYDAGRWLMTHGLKRKRHSSGA